MMKSLILFFICLALYAGASPILDPYLLPNDHPAAHVLEAIFSETRPFRDARSAEAAGFEIIASMPLSFVTVARHPALPSYVFKFYLESEPRCKEGASQLEWLCRRCEGARRIRELIEKKGIHYFSVPDKWLYVSKETAILIETDMEPLDEEASTLAWKTCVTKQHLKELYAILKHNVGSVHVATNVPYTKKNRFAFIDTENVHKRLKLRKVKPYLSEDMRDYWEELIR